MIELPLTIVPDKVQLTIPSQASSHKLDYRSGLVGRQVKSLSDTHSRPGLRLFFTDHPVETINMIRCAGIKPILVTGFIEAYSWYTDQLLSGVKPFSIVADHPIWKVCNYKDRLLSYTAATQYKAIEFTPAPTSRHNKIMTWEMLIKPIAF